PAPRHSQKHRLAGSRSFLCAGGPNHAPLSDRSRTRTPKCRLSADGGIAGACFGRTHQARAGSCRGFAARSAGEGIAPTARCRGAQILPGVDGRRVGRRTPTYIAYIPTGVVSRAPLAVREIEHGAMEISPETDRLVMSIVAMAMRQEPAAREACLRSACQHDP